MDNTMNLTSSRILNYHLRPLILSPTLQITFTTRRPNDLNRIKFRFYNPISTHYNPTPSNVILQLRRRHNMRSKAATSARPTSSHRVTRRNLTRMTVRTRYKLPRRHPYTLNTNLRVHQNRPSTLLRRSRPLAHLNHPRHHSTTTRAKSSSHSIRSDRSSVVSLHHFQ